MAVRALFVGLGGTGGVCLSFARSRLVERLQAAGWQGDLPRNMWRFLHIDVPVETDISDRLRRAERGMSLSLGVKTFTGAEYVNLIYAGENYEMINAEAVRQANDRRAVMGWRPANPTRVVTPLEQGAGQYRAIGAMVAFARRQRIEEELSKAHTALDNDQALDEAQQVHTLLSAAAGIEGGNAGLVPQPPQVFVVSSMVGGAGSGLFTDVASLARGLFGNRVNGLLLAPEAFEQDKIGRYSVANAWALMSELQYLCASEAGEGDDIIAQARLPIGGGPQNDTSVTANMLYFVGRSNKAVTLKGEAAAEHVAGEALANVVTDQSAYTRLTSSAINARANTVDRTGLGASATFRSLGFGRLELGRRRFRRYTTDRLLGLTIRCLLSQSIDLERSANGVLERQADAEVRVANSLRYALAAEAGLQELDDSPTAPQDQVLDALRPRPFKEWSRESAIEAVGERNLAVQTLVERLRQWGLDHQKRDSIRWAEELQANVDRWVGDVQDRLLAVAWDHVSRYGLTVVARTLEFLVNDLTEAASQLRTQAGDLGNKNLGARVGGIVRPDAKGTASAEQRSRLAQTFADHVSERFERQALEATADACEQVAWNLVRPLKNALQVHADDMSKSSNEWLDALAVLPTDGGVDAYRPRSHEVVIESLDGRDGFDARFDRRLETELGANRSIDARNAAVSAIVNLLREQTVWVSRRWQPGAIGFGVNGVASQLSIEADLSIAAIRSAIDTWIDRPNSEMGRYFREGLRAYASEPDHLPVLEKAFSRLLHVGAPLGATNNHVKTLHGEPSTSFVLSEVPFSDMPAVRERLDRAMSSFGIDAGLLLVNAELDVITMMADEGPYQAMCFETIMEPIRSAFSSATAGGAPSRPPFPQSALHRLGERRQAVPLSMTGPLSGRGVVALMIGFILAQAEGILDMTTRTVEDSVARTRRPLPAISYPVDTSELRDYRTEIGRLVDDLKVAYLLSSQDQSLAPLRAYQILLGYGDVNGMREVVRRLTTDQRATALEIANAFRERATSADHPNLDAGDVSTDVAELGHLMRDAADQVEQALRTAGDPLDHGKVVV